MTKTKLGISAKLLAALAYFTAAFGGYTATLLVSGYVLLCEKDAKLRKSALNALLIMVASSAVTTILTLFGGSTISISSMSSNMTLTSLYAGVVLVLNIIPKIVLCVLGIMSLMKKENTEETQTEITEQDNIQ